MKQLQRRDIVVPFLLSPDNGKANPSGIWPFLPWAEIYHWITVGKTCNGAFWAYSLNSHCFNLRHFPYLFWGKNIRRLFSLIMCPSQCDPAHQWIRQNGGKLVKNHILTICVSSTKTIFKDYNKIFIASKEIKRSWCKNSICWHFFLFMRRAKLVPGGCRRFV